MITSYLVDMIRRAYAKVAALPGWLGWALIFVMYLVIFLLIWGTVASW